MKTAKDAPIGKEYGDKTPPYGTDSLPYHRGEDYKCLNNTPVVIGDTTIGLSGETGYTFGPHLHVQEWKGSVYTTRKPQNAFKPGVVVQADNNVKQQWGKHVTVRNKDGWNTTYAHLNKVNVSVGQVIKEEDMLSERILNVLTNFRLGRKPNAGEKKFIGQKTDVEMDDYIMKSKEYAARAAKMKLAQQLIRDNLPGEFK